MRRTWSLLVPLLLVLLSAVPALAAPGDLLWSATYDAKVGHMQDSVGAMVTSPDGSTVFTLGVSTNNLTGRTFSVLRAHDSTDGTRLWSIRGASFVPWDLAVSPDGTTLVATGEVIGEHIIDEWYDRNIHTVAFDASTGASLWSATVGKEVRRDEGRAVTIVADTAFVTGRTTPGTADAITIAYDLGTGTERWRTIRDSGAADFGLDIAPTPDGASVLVAGSAGKSATVTSYDATTGVEAWTTALRDLGDRKTDAQWVFVSGDGLSVYAAGRGRSGDAVVFALEAADGAHRWTAAIDGGGQDVPTGADYSDLTGTVFLAGSSYFSATATSVATVSALDVTSEVVGWTSTIETCPWEAGPIAVAPDGGTVFVGCAGPSSEGGVDMLTTAFAADTGASSWVERFEAGSSTARPVELAVAPSSEAVYVAGYWYPAGDDLDVVTLAYAAT